MFQPNVLCTLTRASGHTDLYGNPMFDRPIPAKCGIVKLVVGDQNVTVRADSSASRGAAQEVVANAVLLFSPVYKPKSDDIVDVVGFRLKITSVFPRHSVNGQLDHYEVRAMAWE